MSFLKIYILILLVFIVNITFSQVIKKTTILDTINVSSIAFKEDTIYHIKRLNISSYYWEIYKDNSKKELLSSNVIKDNLIFLNIYYNNKIRTKYVSNLKEDLLLREDWYENEQFKMKCDYSSSYYKDTAYYSNGKIWFICVYKYGILYDNYLEYYKNGDIKERGNYNFCKVGIWEYFSKSGNLKKKEIFDDNCKIIKSEIYNDIESQ